MKIIQDLLTNKIPRPQTLMDGGVKAIVVHYPANPNQSAKGVIKYWNDETNPVGSAHYVIDLDGIIYQSMPEEEKAYHVGSSQIDPDSGKIYTNYAREVFGEFASNPDTMSPNRCSIGIEMCNIDNEGKHNQETLDAAIELIASLCIKYKLDPAKQVMRHWDVVGWKKCPLWFVNNTNDWISFRTAIQDKMNNS